MLGKWLASGMAVVQGPLGRMGNIRVTRGSDYAFECKAETQTLLRAVVRPSCYLSSEGGSICLLG